MNVGDVKKRWTYLRDRYTQKDRKKINQNVASGSATTSKDKSTFKFREAISFLNDTIEPRPTSSSTLSTSKGGALPSQISPAPTCSTNINSLKRKKSNLKYGKKIHVDSNESADSIERLAYRLRRLPAKERAELLNNFFNDIRGVEKKLGID